MRVSTLSVLCCALLTQSVLAKPVDMVTTPIDLGVVNGEVVNNEIKIEKALSDPILVSVKQQDYEKPLTDLIINNATLISQTPNELVLTIDSPVQGGMTMKSQVRLGMWVNGQRVNLTGKQVGSGVRIATPPRDSYKKYDLRTEGPIEMTLPKAYRGEFKYSIEIEASTAV